jgi:hypothetical protein
LIIDKAEKGERVNATHFGARARGQTSAALSARYGAPLFAPFFANETPIALSRITLISAISSLFPSSHLQSSDPSYRFER